MHSPFLFRPLSTAWCLLLGGPGGWRRLSGVGWFGRAGARESPSTLSVSPPPQYYGPIPSALDLAFSQAVSSQPAGSASLPDSSQLSGCLVTEEAWAAGAAGVAGGGGVPTDCLCLKPRLENWEVGCRDVVRGWG